MKRIGHKGLLAGVAAALGIAAGCGPAMQEYQPQKGSGPLLPYLTASAVILVGVVEAAEGASWIHSSKYDGQPVQLYRLRVNVELVLRGEAPSGDVNIYCFMARGSEGGIQRMSFVPGNLYIFYLRKEAGEWRTACDIYEHCVDRVLTGRHPAFRRNHARPISDDILEILFTRGENVSDGAMVDALAGGPPYDYGSRWKYEREEVYTKLLQRTAKTETPPVRAEACELLNNLHKPCEVIIKDQ